MGLKGAILTGTPDVLKSIRVDATYDKKKHYQGQSPMSLLLPKECAWLFLDSYCVRAKAEGQSSRRSRAAFP
jgi:hypothetical protein